MFCFTICKDTNFFPTEQFFFCVSSFFHPRRGINPSSPHTIAARQGFPRNLGITSPIRLRRTPLNRGSCRSCSRRHDNIGRLCNVSPITSYHVRGLQHVKGSGPRSISPIHIPSRERLWVRIARCKGYTAPPGIAGKNQNATTQRPFGDTATPTHPARNANPHAAIAAAKITTKAVVRNIPLLQPVS